MAWVMIDSMQNIKPGDKVRALTATEQWIPLRATTAVTDGIDFPVVWLCSDEDWSNMDDENRSATPWPAEAVEVRATEGGQQ